MDARPTHHIFLLLLVLAAGVAGCKQSETPAMATDPATALVDQYTPFTLTSDLSSLSEAERSMIPLLIEAAQEMEPIFWRQAYGDPQPLLEALQSPALREYARINFGPWDRLNGNKPFVPGAGPKPLGAGFYPADLTRAEFEQAAALRPDLRSPYTMVRRTSAGDLEAVPYHVYFAEPISRAAAKLEEAAALAPQESLRRYLLLRAEALRTDDYYASDVAWMEMKDNRLDLVIGPIENYEDALFGYKTASEGFVLVKDEAWSRRLARYASLLPMLQEGLPVPDAYRAETPGTDSDLNAYDAILYTGDANAGSKTIAINLPNDERVQLEYGTRRLQLKNAMRAKFDKILLPIADALIAADQRPHVTFDAFFGNTMFHEVAHGLGIKNLVNGTGTVREALLDTYNTMEEGKADVLGLYMVGALQKAGEYDTDMLDHYATFLAGIFRSVRFGAASAHGRANRMRFNYFKERGAFTRDEATGTYRVVPERFAAAVDALSQDILRLQGDGDYAAVAAFIDKYGAVDEQLTRDLDRLSTAGIPVDVVFEQGLSELAR